MLVGCYGAALVSGSAYRQGGAALAMAFGRENLPQLEFIAYVGLFVLVFAVIALLIFRAYPSSRLRRGFGSDNVVGAALGAIWGVLLLIAVLTMLRYYAIVQWRGHDTGQQGVAPQMSRSPVAPVLEDVAGPPRQGLGARASTPGAPRPYSVSSL